MDYVVGSVAALVTGNVTPNRPKYLKRALTPIKHQQSPNVTPKSEFAEDRSIFLSPTLQKKKAIVKKSPKRIFENPDLDVSNDGESNITSPKADKVKKHLRDELEADSGPSSKSPKNKMSEIKNSDGNVEFSLGQNENTPKKNKNNKTDLLNEDTVTESKDTNILIDSNTSPHSTKNKKKKNKMLNSTPKVDKSLLNNSDNDDNENKINKQQTLPPISPKKKNQLKKAKEVKGEEKSQLVNNDQDNSIINDVQDSDNTLDSETVQIQKKNRKRKNKSKTTNSSDNKNIEMDEEEKVEKINKEEKHSKKKKTGKKEIYVNPNAITDKDTDSEHESDDEIETEDEHSNKEVLDTGPAQESSDEEEKEESKRKEVPTKTETVISNKEPIVETQEQINRTLFVGNVLFSAKCKQEIKKMFSKYGQIETVRIRTVPVKDGRVTPKLAVIKNELHPDRSTVNVYVKFHEASSVKKALAENGKVLNGHHLRVTHSDSTGSEHDPKCSIFIGNLPFAVEDEVLHQMFQHCGEIESVRIIRDKKTNAGKGFGYVNFKSKDAVELALALTDEDLTIKNRIIRVKRCTLITHKQKAYQDNRRANFQENSRGNIQRNTREQGNFRGGHNEQRNFRGNVEPGNFRGGHNAQRNFRGNVEPGNFRGGHNEQRNFRGNVEPGNFRGGHNAQRNFRGNVEPGNFRGGHNAQRNFRGNVNNFGRQGKFENRPLRQNDNKEDGAYRRLMNKRRNQNDGGEGPLNKRQRNMSNPGKKERQEFVGMTAEKKKKHKMAKGQKKRKALSEILTKQ